MSTTIDISVDTKCTRDVGLDFTRAVYILMMIFYHCYEIAFRSGAATTFNANLYLGLVTGSFPWLAGFLVSYHYLKQDKSLAAKTSGRLFSRGLRLLIIYASANLLVLVYFPEILPPGFMLSGERPLTIIISTDPDYVAYDILVSLGLVMILGSMAVRIYGWYGNKALIPLQFVLGCIAPLVLVLSDHLLLACGLAGFYFGFAATDTLFSAIYRRSVIVVISLAYGLALASMTNPKMTGLGYVVAVFMLFYSVREIGRRWRCGEKWLAREIDLYAQYSLFIYLTHVALLLLPRHLLPQMSQELPVSLLFFILLAAVLLTMSILTRVVESAQRASPLANRLYRTVFG